MHNKGLLDYIVIAIDPGTIVTGYAVMRVVKGTYSLLDYGCIKPPKDAVLSKRYHAIFQSIVHLIQVHKPHQIAVETPFIHKNPQSALKLGGALGCVLLAGREHGLPIFGYAPCEVKRGITSSGRATKEEVERVLRSMFGIAQIVRLDASDAIAVAAHHAQSLKGAVMGLSSIKEL